MIMNGHKKNAGQLSIINSKALVSPLNNNRTIARALYDITNLPIIMVDELIRNQRKHLLSIIPVYLKILQIFMFGIISVKCLQYVIDPALREPLPTTESL